MLLCLSSNHRNASFELLEKSVDSRRPTPRTALAALERHRHRVPSCLLTCNRFEAYLDIDEPLTAMPPLQWHRLSQP